MTDAPYPPTPEASSEPAREEPDFEEASYTARPAAVEDEITILVPVWTEDSASTGPPPVQPPADRKRSVWHTCLIAAVAGVIVLSLIGSSVFSLYWFLTTRSERAAEVAAQEATPITAEEPTAESEHEIEERATPEAAEIIIEEPTAAPTADANAVNRIVYVNDQRQIATIGPDGSDERRITADARSYIFPAWSPDGQSIATIGAGLDGVGLYVMTDEQQTETPKPLYFSDTETPFYLYWAPDSRQISFLANDATAGISLNMVDSSGEIEAHVLAVGSPMYWNWTAESNELLMHSGGNALDSRLMLIDDVGEAQSPQIALPGPFQAPGISTSGRYWAYSQYRDGGVPWLVINDTDSEAEQSHRHAGSVAFNWSPTNEELAFISGEDENMMTYFGPLRLLDAETGDVRLLSSDLVLAFFWSPDGAKIVTLGLPAQNGLGEQIDVRRDSDLQPVFFQSGSPRDAVQQQQRNLLQINVIDVRTGEGLKLTEAALSPAFLSQFLPYFDQYAYSHLLWSPDSTSLVLPVAGDQGSEISVLNTRTGRFLPLAEGSMAFWSRQ